MRRTGTILPLLLLFLAMNWQATAGSSLVLSPGQIGTFVDPVQPASQNWRVEFQMHDWTMPVVNTLTARVALMDGTGLYVALNMDLIWILNNRDGSQCLLSLSGRTNVLLRIQRNPAALRMNCEIWNYDGSGYQQTSDVIQHSVATIYSGGQLGSALTVARLAYFRMFDTLLLDGTRPAPNATGNMVNFTFENNLTDTSGLGRNITLAGAQFASTPNQTLPFIPKAEFFLQ